MGDIMNLNVNAFMETLPIMAKGMLGIFAVTAVIIAAVIILNKVCSGIDKK